MEYGQRFYKEDKHYSELGIATLTSYFVNANKDPKKGKKVSPSDFFFFKPEDITDILPDVATTFFSLASDRNLPDWSVPLVPLQDFLNLRARGKIARLRALIHQEYCVIICPEISDTHIFAGFILFNHVPVAEYPKLTLTNPDTGGTIEIITPQPEKGDNLLLVYSNYYVSLA